MEFEIGVNGLFKKDNADPNTPLVWILRDEFELTRTKFGCGVASCGNCSVHINEKAARSCQIKVNQLAADKITTIEGTNGKVASAVRKAWVKKNVVKCCYCQSGQIMTAVPSLSQNPNPSDEEIELEMSGIYHDPVLGILIHGSEGSSALFF